MNLRVTPNVNTQNNRQNPSFGMVRCPDEATAARLLEIADMAGVGLSKLVHPVEKRTLLHACLTTEQADELSKFTDVFMSDGDLREIIQRTKPEDSVFAVMKDMAKNAKEITMDAVNAMAKKFRIPEVKVLCKSGKDALTELGVDTKPFHG